MKDPIAVIEAAYDLDAADQTAWLAGAARALRANVTSGDAAVAFAYAIGPDGYITPETPVQIDAPAGFCESLLHVNLTPSEGAVVSSYYLTSGLGVGSRLAAQIPGSGPSFFRRAILAFGFSDMVTLNAADPSRSGCMIGVAVRHGDCASRAARPQWNRVAAHVAAGLRLFRWLAPQRGKTGPAVDAVLSPGGRVEHAEGEASSRTARAALRSAVLAVERARGPLRHRRPDEAIEIWRGLTLGRWSLVNHFERDGRRYVVAHRNAPEAKDPRALTRRERQVVGFAALGQGNKLIAYELGLSPSTVGVLMARAARKLGARSRAELLQLTREPPSGSGT